MAKRSKRDEKIAAEVAKFEDERAEEIARQRKAKLDLSTWASPISTDPSEFKKILLKEIKTEYGKGGKGIKAW